MSLIKQEDVTDLNLVKFGLKHLNKLIDVG